MTLPTKVTLCDAAGNPLVAEGATGPSSASANQTAAGGPTAANIVAIFNGAGKLEGLRISYKGGSSVFLTMHNAATATSPTTANMLGPGIPISSTQPFLIYEPPKAISFTAGCKIAVSSTQDTYTASSDQITVWGQWS